MQLNNKQLNTYRNKINQLCHMPCLLHENGIFELHNLDESSANFIVTVLKKQPFITDVRALESSKYNFNKIDVSNGFVKPEKYFTIRGLLKDVNLNEAIEVHDELNPKIWTKDNELLPDVRAKILQIVDKFKTQLATDGVDLIIDDIYLLGSNANFNYNEDSDLDIHIIADESFDCSEEHLSIIYNCYKTLFNKKYNIQIKGIDVELYVENKDKLSNISSGVYSFNNGWIKTPSQYEIPKIDQVSLDKKVKLWEDKYFDITLNPSVTKIDNYLDDIYELRQESIRDSGEFGEGNLVFKEIRRLGYLDDLRNLKVDLTSKELSLEALSESSDGALYVYDGPLYTWGIKILDKWTDKTKAVSAKKALNNLTYKARKAFDLSAVELVPENLEKVEDEKTFTTPNQNIKKCPKCGNPLTTNGECPLCDLGDESVLDEHITPIGRASAEINGIDFENEEVMNGKVKDWMCADQPYEFQLEDIPDDLTWGKLIEAIKKGEMHKVLSLDTAPQERVWQRACELYYLQTGYFADKDFESMCKNPEKRKRLQLVKFEEDK